MKSFTCLIQTHTGQDKGVQREGVRKWERESHSETHRRRQWEENHKVQERVITETFRQWADNEGGSELEKLCLSKESSVLAQELKPLSPCAGTLCPGAPASFGTGGCGAWLVMAKQGISVRDCQITDLLKGPATGGRICPLSLLPSTPFSFRPSLHDCKKHQILQSPRFTFRWYLNTAAGFYMIYI